MHVYLNRLIQVEAIPWLCYCRPCCASVSRKVSRPTSLQQHFDQLQLDIDFAQFPGLWHKISSRRGCTDSHVNGCLSGHNIIGRVQHQQKDLMFCGALHQVTPHSLPSLGIEPLSGDMYLLLTKLKHFGKPSSLPVAFIKSLLPSFPVWTPVVRSIRFTRSSLINRKDRPSGDSVRSFNVNEADVDAARRRFPASYFNSPWTTAYAPEVFTCHPSQALEVCKLNRSESEIENTTWHWQYGTSAIILDKYNSTLRSLMFAMMRIHITSNLMPHHHDICRRIMMVLGMSQLPMWD
ncbi:uncharacterized protein M421DRAFT_305108 [Didymella exigua CBS 183.55]|uniref:Uncharacterized protein n=1 Tax=Didymella exigua CBS 183.55 TaxID=1150837 RepID=A0A6A5R9S2_9PLEO|nr:uncharacterized protein M421DRAFT_305108 [Didymella exigua CBS 183.55]KAF1923764.1 hypothetical protein M421DRAFT_305108 [Didymella exigua CBS 183.55]